MAMVCALVAGFATTHCAVGFCEKENVAMAEKKLGDLRAVRGGVEWRLTRWDLAERLALISRGVCLWFERRPASGLVCFKLECP